MKTQQGITLIGAIFVLIIVSLLGQYLITIAGVQRQTSLLSLQSSRAYQAANAGIEWAIATSPFCSSANIAIDNFTVAITSIADPNNPYDENGVPMNICSITSIARYGSYQQVDYVSRKLEVIIHD